jgi:hypothetical protein
MTQCSVRARCESTLKKRALSTLILPSTSASTEHQISPEHRARSSLTTAILTPNQRTIVGFPLIIKYLITLLINEKTFKGSNDDNICLSEGCVRSG